MSNDISRAVAAGILKACSIVAAVVAEEAGNEGDKDSAEKATALAQKFSDRAKELESSGCCGGCHGGS